MNQPKVKSLKQKHYTQTPNATVQIYKLRQKADQYTTIYIHLTSQWQTAF